MGDIYLYNNEMWKVKHKFLYSGQKEEFTLDPGRYLCICKGAKGGPGYTGFENKGGCSYGILNLTSALTAYAVVGGDGVKSEYVEGQYVRAPGGYNGGGEGGLSCKPTDSSCTSGSSGGGASDIRLSNEGDQETTIQHQVPNWFTEVEYIRSDGTQYIDTGVIGTNGMGFDIKFTPHNSMSDSNYGTIFGAESGWRSREYILTTYTYTGNSGHFGYGSNNIPEAHMVKDVETVMSFHNSVLTVNGVDYSVTEPAAFTTPNTISIFQLRRPSEYREAGKVTLKYFKLFNPEGKCIRYFVPFVNTGTEIDISNVQLSQGTIYSGTGTPGADNDDPSLYSIRVRSQTYIPIDPAHKYISVSGSASTDLEMLYIFYNSEQQFLSYHDGWVSSGSKIVIPAQAHYLRFIIRRANVNAISVSDITSIGLKYYESTVVSGLYDLANDKIYEKRTGNNFTVGNPVQTKTIYNETKIINIGLNSRIMVAGGGGGGSQITSADYSDFTGFGGGIYGGYPDIKTSLDHAQAYAGQASGYSFGNGQNAVDKTAASSWNADSGRGIGGGGGGWYGGYSPNVRSQSETYSSGNGGGGTGYILTTTSYQPSGYMIGVEPREDIYFTNTLMTSGLSDEACVIICEPTDIYLPKDKVICECIGSGTSFTLLAGTYNVKCSGGYGAHRTRSAYAGKGGYSEGVLSTESDQTAYAYVGGSGFYTAMRQNAAYMQSTHPTLSFNGGGLPAAYTSLANTGQAAGGGTDLRIGTDSLYARAIVAGGAGGTGRTESSGGSGGGTSGGTYTNRSGGTLYGDNYGPGTQSAAGAGSMAEISGGFGFGGNGNNRSEVGYGGAGGGGWYGGSGTYPDGSGDDEKGGCGGSGYVLTETSYKPTGYLLDSSNYFTNPVTIAGGAERLYPLPITGMVLEALKLSIFKMLVHDSDGYKYYDEEHETWTFLKSDGITVEDFDNYGIKIFPGDTGLNDTYDILMLDQWDVCNVFEMLIIPPKQSVRFRYKTPNTLTGYVIDADVDSSVVDFNVTVTRTGQGSNAYLHFNFEYDIHDIPNKKTRVYYVSGHTQGVSPGGPPPPKKEKTIQHIDLLQVGASSRMPSRYKNYIGSFIGDLEAITTIGSAVTCEYNRCIYSITLCNNKVLRFAKLNLITNVSTIIKDIQKTDISGFTYCGDIKVDDDYIYFTAANNDSIRYIWKTPNSSSTVVNGYQMPYDGAYMIEAYGRIGWYDKNNIAILVKRGLTLFNIKTNTFSYSKWNSNSRTCRDFVIGKEIALAITSDTSYDCGIINMNTGAISWLTSYGQRLVNTDRSVGCYHDGIFYILQKQTLHFFDEVTKRITFTISTPFSTRYEPKQIDYSDGILFITMRDARVLYMYNIETHNFYATELPFTMDNFTENGWMRMTAFKKYCFIPNIKLFTLSYTNNAKYNLGFKCNQFLIVTNQENAEDLDNQYEYDERFVTFDSDNMTIHENTVTMPLEEIDHANHIKRVQMNKNQYNKIIDSYFTHEDIEENTEESEGT